MTADHGLPAIPAEGRLLRSVRRATEHARNASLIAKLTPDTADTTKLDRPRPGHEAPDPVDLRGIPVVGRGIAGISPGSRPDAITDRDDPE